MHGFTIESTAFGGAAKYQKSVSAGSVVGIPDAKWGEAVQPAVKIRKDYPVDLAEMTAFVKRELGSVKAPK